MEWGPLVCLKAAGFAKVVASNTIGALDIHFITAHGAPWLPCKTLHLQQEMEISASEV